MTIVYDVKSNELCTSYEVECECELGLPRPFSIMLVNLIFNATRNSRIKPKNC